MEIPNELINIQSKITTNNWKNNLAGYFIFDNTRYLYHFIETTNDLNNLIESENTQLRKNPICAGFIAYLISNLGKKATYELYASYLSKVKQEHMDKVKYNPAFNPNTELSNFYEYYFSLEEILMLKSNKIYSFIEQESVDLIQRYIKGYETYISKYINKDLPENTRNKFSNFKNLINYRFDLEIDIESMRKQYSLLRTEGFIECEEDSFLFRMGYDVEEVKLDKIKWIKKNSKSAQANKKSLLDYLILVGIREVEIKQKINTIFITPNGGPFKPNNYSYKDGQLDSNSQYHNDLVKIVTKSKET